MQGDDVALLHTELQKLGLIIPLTETAPRTFGTRTLVAVRRLQAQAGLANATGSWTRPPPGPSTPGSTAAGPPSAVECGAKIRVSRVSSCGPADASCAARPCWARRSPIVRATTRSPIAPGRSRERPGRCQPRRGRGQAAQPRGPAAACSDTAGRRSDLRPLSADRRAS